MPKMAGIGLMIAGVLIFVIGAILYNSSKKSVVQTLNNPEPVKPTEMTVIEPKIIENDNELEKAIEIAIADGVLTNNEKTIIRKITEKKGLDFNEVIKNVEQQMAESNDESETELINYNTKNGYDFEKFIVQKFDKKFFKVMEWTSDKFVDGVYSKKNEDPDILLELKANGKLYTFAVECKWRQTLLPEGIEFAGKEQFQRYKKYEESKDIPVFVAIGIGGKASSPNKLFVVPLRKLSSNFIDREKLQIFTKSVDGDFYYDLKNGFIN
jgi:hypothetical protein